MSYLEDIKRQTREDFHTTWSGWKEKLKRKPSQWATEERRIAAGQSPLTRGQDIPYLHEIMPHCVEPMDCADDQNVNTIVLWLARRMGKTEGICANIFGRTVTDDPGNIYSNWPVEDSCDRFSRDVIEPMIEACPSLKRVFVEKKSRDSGRTINYKRYYGGSIYLVHAGSKSKSRGMAAKVIALHEVDAYPVSSQGEGDPIAKALGRAEGFGDAIKIIESTGTFAADIDPATGKKIYRSNIERWYDRSDQRKWFCACRKCGREQWLKFEQIKTLARKSGNNLWFYICEFCDVDHDEPQWRKMVSNGLWKPTAPFNGIAGFWINGFNSLLPTSKGYTSKLHQFAAEGHQALNGKPEEKQVWINEVKTELWNIATETEAPPAWKPIFDRREDYGLVVPAKGLYLSADVDCQLNRLEVEWVAWGRNEESWGMDHVTLDGHVRDREVWQLLRRELTRKWNHAFGGLIQLGIAFVDGGHYAEDVYRFMQEIARNPVPGLTGKCRATKGIGQHGHPIIDPTWRTVAKNLKGYHIGTWEAKDRIYERLAMVPEEGDTREGIMHYNMRYSEEYFQQLTVERVTVTYEKGQTVRKYVNPHQQRNEALDLRVGNLAAVRFHRRNFDLLEEGLKQSAAEEKAKEVGVVKPEVKKSARKRNSFVSGWR